MRGKKTVNCKTQSKRRHKYEFRKYAFRKCVHVPHIPCDAYFLNMTLISFLADYLLYRTTVRTGDSCFQQTALLPCSLHCLKKMSNQAMASD